MLSLDTIRKRVRKLARIIDAPADSLPTYGRSRDFGYPHIEIVGSEYHWVVCERGLELQRRTFTELEDLLFTVFRSVTFSMACEFELAHRIEGQSFRRLLFQKQLELLAQLSPE